MSQVKKRQRNNVAKTKYRYETNKMEIRIRKLTGLRDWSWNSLGLRMAGAKRRRKIKPLTAVYLISLTSEGDLFRYDY